MCIFTSAGVVPWPFNVNCKLYLYIFFKLAFKEDDLLRLGDNTVSMDLACTCECAYLDKYKGENLWKL